MDPDPDTPLLTPNPGILRYVLGFLLVGAAWGLTTPFMRKAAITSAETTTPASRKWLDDVSEGWVKRKFWGLLYAVGDVLRRPAYAVPLVVNLTGSVWFFLLIGQAGELACNFCCGSMKGEREDFGVGGR